MFRCHLLIRLISCAPDFMCWVQHETDSSVDIDILLIYRYRGHPRRVELIIILPLITETQSNNLSSHRYGRMSFKNMLHQGLFDARSKSFSCETSAPVVTR